MYVNRFVKIILVYKPMGLFLISLCFFFVRGRKSSLPRHRLWPKIGGKIQNQRTKFTISGWPQQRMLNI